MKLTLPFPPSVNGYWRSTNQGMKISAKGRTFRTLAVIAILDQLKRHPATLTELVEVHLILYPPDRARRDLDNFQKALFDALTHAGVWADDSQVKRMLVEWGAVTCHGKAEITIKPYEVAA